ncbi:MAG TPA: ABC transporter substrate-binding protein [Armatimonadota bacterium]|nr:ABC transporter substrate-binding protein [Armatimonadota bacterium]
MRRRQAGRYVIVAALGVLVLLGLVHVWRGSQHAAAPRTTAPSARHGGETAGRATVRYASGFTLEYRRGYKILRVLSPWRDANTTFTYLLVPRGAAPPAAEANATIVEVPVRRIVITSTTYVPYFAMLGLEETLVGIAGGALVNTPAVAERIRAKRIVEVGTGTGMGAALDLERLYSLQPDLIMTYGTGDPQYDQQDKLREAGFRVALNAEYMETTPLGRTEWMKFIAAFFDKDAEAERQFADIARRYEAQAAKARAVAKRPTVFCGMDFQGVWHMPGGASYVAAYLRDAGADYLWKEDTSTGSMPLNMETVIARARDADIWLNPGVCRSLQELSGADTRYALFRAYRAGRVYNNNAKVGAGGGNDYWETGVAHPDRVLAELIGIIHPELEPDHRRVWYQQLPARVQGQR